MNETLKKYLVGAAIIVAYVAYLVFNDNNVQNVPATATAIPTPTNGNGTTSSAANTNSIPATASGNGNPGTNAGAYQDGTYAGSVADAFYGNLQVAAVVQGGRLADIQILQYPQSSGHTKELSAAALPVLKQEALTAQSAQVDVVSGATQTSQAFEQSLAAALTKAK